MGLLILIWIVSIVLWYLIYKFGKWAGYPIDAPICSLLRVLVLIALMVLNIPYATTIPRVLLALVVAFTFDQFFFKLGKSHFS